MIVDSSALIAMLRAEPEQERCLDAVLAAPEATISAANLLEASIVIDVEGDAVASRRLDQVRIQLGIAVAPVTHPQVEIARQAYRDFGKGSGHPAGLNFGDCFAYALASEQDQPLLFIGDDFSHTDVRSALNPT